MNKPSCTHPDCINYNRFQRIPSIVRRGQIWNLAASNFIEVSSLALIEKTLVGKPGLIYSDFLQIYPTHRADKQSQLEQKILPNITGSTTLSFLGVKIEQDIRLLHG